MPNEPVASLLQRLRLQLSQLASRSKCPDIDPHDDDLINDLYCKIVVAHGGYFATGISDDLVKNLYQNRNGKRAPTKLNAESYIVRSFKNLIKDRERAFYRRRRRECAVAIISSNRSRSCNHSSFGDVEVLRGRSEFAMLPPEAIAIRYELRWHIKRAMRLANLRPDHRCAFWAWFRTTHLPHCLDPIDQRAPLEVFAKRRGVAPSTVKVWAMRARDMLRPHLEHLRNDL